MAFVKCKHCNNHYFESNVSCPFCSPSVTACSSASTVAAASTACFDLDRTDLSALQKKMVLQATATAQKKGSPPKRNKAKTYVHDGFQWSLYDQWIAVFADSSGLEQWPAAYELYRFEEQFHRKTTAEILPHLTRKQLRNLCDQENCSWSRLATKKQLVRGMGYSSAYRRIRTSALELLHEELIQKVIRERKELFSAWLYFGTSLKEKLADWKEFRVERVAISPAADSCVHCKKLKGREVAIDQVLPLLLQHHPGCRCDIVLAQSEFSRGF